MKRIMREIISAIKRPEMAILPGQIAFFLVLSIIPIINVLGFIASFFSVSLDFVFEFMQTNLPEQVNSILLPFFNGQGIGANIIIYTILGFYLSSNGPKSIIIASNTLYGIEGYNTIVRRLKAIIMTIIFIFLIVFILVVLGFGNSIVNALINLKLFKNFSREIMYIYILLKWPIAFIIIFFSIKVIYTMAPDKVLKSKFVNKGALFSTTTLMLVTAAFSYYVTNIANYNLFYGNLSNIIVFMIWIYIISTLLVIGISINVGSYNIDKNNE